VQAAQCVPIGFEAATVIVHKNGMGHGDWRVIFVVRAHHRPELWVLANRRDDRTRIAFELDGNVVVKL
jgi:hypothetical protein